MLVGQAKLNGSTHSNENTPRNCPFFPFQRESVSHLLFECQVYDPGGKEDWERTMSMLPEGIANSMRLMNAEEKSAFILSGFNRRYIAAWDDIYLTIMAYCITRYDQRQLLRENES